MTWRGRVSLGDDLRRLHESARASDMSREIGYSSVTEGEGSLDLLTESGDVRAAFGDQPDGRFGVSIWHGGSLRFIPDLIEDLEAEDGSLSGRLDGHDFTLSSHNTRITTAQARADSAYSYADTVYSAVLKRATNDRVDGVLGIAQAAQTRADDAHGDAAAAQSTATDANTRAVNAQSRADSAWTRAGTGIANAATAQARADAAYQLANGRATKAEVAAAEDKAENARLQALSVQNALISWINAARNEIPGLPPPPGF